MGERVFIEEEEAGWAPKWRGWPPYFLPLPSWNFM
jgi:hypothetical protein